MQHLFKYKHLLPALLLLPLITACDDEELSDTSSDAGATGRARLYAENYKSSLLRTYGVGFGYDATGKYADYSSVRDRIIDLNALQSVEAQLSMNILTDNLTPRTEQTVDEGFDSEELAQNITASAGLSLKLGSFFEGEVAACYSTDYLTTDKYSFCTIRNNYVSASRHIDPLLIQGLAEEYPSILTDGFRKPLERIRLLVESNQRGAAEMTIDTLLMNYGTHFVYQADLGGSLIFTSVYTKSSLADATTLSVEAKAKIMSMCNMSYTSTDGDYYYQEQSIQSYTLTAIGGKANLASQISTQKGDDIPSELLESWYQSIAFDPEDATTSNVELVDFKLAPIYELIPDELVRNIVAERFGIYRETAYASMAKPQNAAYDCIPLHDLGLNTYYTPFARLTDPERGVVVEAVTELIPIDDIMTTVTTFYPVIDGQVAEEGLSLILLDENDEPSEDDLRVKSLYVVSWLEKSKASVSALIPIEEADTLFYNNGQLGIRRIAGHDYTTVDVELENMVYCWDGYYGDIDMIKVGRYYVMPGPQIEAKTSDKASDLNNDYNKVLLDPPYGWQFASDTCGIFHDCLDYLEQLIGIQDMSSPWRSPMLLRHSTTQTGDNYSYSFRAYDSTVPGFVGDEDEATELLRQENGAPVLLIRDIPYTYR